MAKGVICVHALECDADDYFHKREHCVWSDAVR